MLKPAGFAGQVSGVVDFAFQASDFGVPRGRARNVTGFPSTPDGGPEGFRAGVRELVRGDVTADLRALRQVLRTIDGPHHGSFLAFVAGGNGGKELFGPARGAFNLGEGCFCVGFVDCVPGAVVLVGYRRTVTDVHHFPEAAYQIFGKYRAK